MSRLRSVAQPRSARSGGPGAPGEHPARRSVLLVDDEGLFIAALAISLRQQRCDVQVTALIDAVGLSARGGARRTGVAVLDLAAPPSGSGINPLSLVGPLTRAGWTVLVAGDPGRDEARIAVAVERGASGLLSVTASFGTSVYVIAQAADGHEVMTTSERHAWLHRYCRDRAIVRRHLRSRYAQHGRA